MKRLHVRNRPQPTVLIETENRLVAAVSEAQRCSECRASSSTEVVRMLNRTLRCVKTECTEVRRVMTWGYRRNQQKQAGVF